MIHESIVKEIYGNDAVRSWKMASEQNFFAYDGALKLFWNYVSIPWLWKNFPEKRDRIKNLFPKRKATIGVHVGYCQVEDHPKIKKLVGPAAYDLYLARVTDVLKNSVPRILFVEATRLTPTLTNIDLRESLVVPTHPGSPDILADLMECNPSDFYSILKKSVDEVEVVGETYNPPDNGCVGGVVSKIKTNHIPFKITHVYPNRT